MAAATAQTKLSRTTKTRFCCDWRAEAAAAPPHPSNARARACSQQQVAQATTLTTAQAGDSPPPACRALVQTHWRRLERASRVSERVSASPGAPSNALPEILSQFVARLWSERCSLLPAAAAACSSLFAATNVTTRNINNLHETIFLLLI